MDKARENNVLAWCTKLRVLLLNNFIWNANFRMINIRKLSILAFESCAFLDDLNCVLCDHHTPN
jgi:hypothetical protein